MIRRFGQNHTSARRAAIGCDETHRGPLAGPGASSGRSGGRNRLAPHRPPFRIGDYAGAAPSSPVSWKVILGSSEWCWWDSWDDPGRGRVQICHKGAPRRDRPRMKPRNINDSLPVFRLDSGLCGRFGQLAPSRAPWGGRLPASARSMASVPARAPARRAVTDRAGTPFDRAGPARAPPRGRLRRPDPRDRHLTAENVC